MKTELQDLYQYDTDISITINQCKHSVQRAVNDAIIMLYWTIVITLP